MAPPSSRYESLDVLRGVAILGTLATNIWIFTNPEGLIGYLTNSTAAATPSGWLHVERVLQQLAQGKFLGLLTIMFGIGLAIQQRSAVRAGRTWPGRYPWRAGLLLLDGAVHFLLVAEFDVLMGYAVTGVVVAYVLATSERSQRRWMVIAATAHVLLLTGVTVLLLSSRAGEDTRPVPLDPNPYADGTWWDLVVFRVDNVVLFRIEPVFVFALSVAGFLAGAALLRAGVLDVRGIALRRRLLVVGAVAFVIDLILGLWFAPTGVVVTRYGTAPVVALGLLALVVEIVRALPHPGPVRRRLEEVGRTALSCYVLQNVVASALCYGWGLGLAQRMPPEVRVGGTVAIYLVVVAVVIAFAHLWLRRFSRGPLESLMARLGARSDGVSSVRDRRPTRAAARGPRPGSHRPRGG